MAWNPDVYNKFKAERYAPFYDLIELCVVKTGMQIIDLGCGTGEITKMLAGHIAGSEVLGIDSSPEMLAKSAAFTDKNLRFECRSIEDQIRTGKTWDLIFSNAALQWVEGHVRLIPALISLLNENGQIAFQVPSNDDHFTHTYLQELAWRDPYRRALSGWMRISPVLSIEEYASILFEHHGKNITVFEKVYPHVLPDSDSLFDWVSGTALIRYLEKLPGDLREPFKDDYRQGLANKFRETPVLYPFKRIIISAEF